MTSVSMTDARDDRPPPKLSSLRHSCLDILSSFGLRHSSFLLFAILLLPASVLAADDPARYRTGKPESRVLEVPAAIQQGVFADPERFVGPLVQHLAGDAADPLLSVKRLHDWIAENIAYDTDAFFAGTRIDTSWAETLRRRKSVCHGYATLLARMCELAGVRCQVISGYGRGYDFLNGGSEDPRRENHAWNAVHVAGAWRLVDVTWDAGHVEGRTFRKQFGTTYLFLDPAQFVYTHFPAQPAWQLLPQPLSPERFRELPYLPGRFFEYGLRLASELQRVTPVKESVRFAVETPASVAIGARFLSPAGKEIPQRTLVAREGKQARVMVCFPEAGRWTVRLFARRSDAAGMMDMVATLEFAAGAGTPYVFPTTYAAYDQYAAGLESPLFEPLAADRPQVFRLRMGRPADVFLVLGSSPWRKLTKDNAGLYQIEAPVPRGQPASLVASDPNKPGAFTTLIQYAAPR